MQGSSSFVAGSAYSQLGIVEIEYSFRMLLLFVGRLSNENDYTVEISEVKKIQEEIQNLYTKMVFYTKRIEQLENVTEALHKTVIEYKTREDNIERRIRQEYKQRWISIENQKWGCQEEQIAITDLNFQLLRCQNYTQMQKWELHIMEYRLGEMSLTLDSLSRKVLEMEKTNASISIGCNMEVKKAQQIAAVYESELQFFENVQDELIGKRMYDKWIFDRTSVQTYWDSQIMQTQTVLKHMYSMRLKAEKNEIEGNFKIKVFELESEIVNFRRYYQDELRNIHSQFEKLKRNVTDYCNRKDNQKSQRALLYLLDKTLMEIISIKKFNWTEEHKVIDFNDQTWSEYPKEGKDGEYLVKEDSKISGDQFNENIPDTEQTEAATENEVEYQEVVLGDFKKEIIEKDTNREDSEDTVSEMDVTIVNTEENETEEEMDVQDASIDVHSKNDQ